VAVKLNNVVPWGRSFDEYVRMFALNDEDLSRRIADCAAGPSSFAAEMHERGGKVVAVDPIYEFSAEQIRERVETVADDMIGQVKGQMGQFVWEYIRSPEHLGEVRLGAMEKFLSDFETDVGRERYRVESLPRLEFADGEFELALCSHFLFLYSGRLTEEFHISAVRELLRVAKEVRIFPVTDLAGRLSLHLPAVREAFETELVEVEYEFLKGAKQMLVVRR
jgi:hypothetical protein